jgi:hypothetical protein
MALLRVQQQICLGQAARLIWQIGRYMVAGTNELKLLLSI